MFNYASLAFTDAIKLLQEKYGSRQVYDQMEKRQPVHGFSPADIEYIQARDSFYMASLGENGYPYMQHRGGPPGFLKVVDHQTLAFLDFTGNKQFISVGNLVSHPNVSLFLMDYPNRTRMKVYARVELLPLGLRPALEEKLHLPNYQYKPDRIMIFHVQAFDWNCPQHITPRYTVEELQGIIVAYDEQIRRLESEIEQLKSLKE